MAVAITQTTGSISRVEEIFLDAVLKASSFDAGFGIKQVQGTRDKFSMWEMSTSGVVQDYLTAPVEQGNAAISDTEFTIDKKSINLPIPYELFKNTEWKDAVANIHNMGIPEELKVAMVQNIVDSALKQVENELWSSNAGATNDPVATINGFCKIINDKLTAASLTAQTLSGAASLTDPTTIQARFNAMVDVVPVALLAEQGDVFFHVSPATEWAYRRSLQTQNMAVLSSEPTNFGGFGIKVVPNLNTRWAVLGKTSNLGIGLPSAFSDIISLDVIDQKENLKNQANIFGNFGYGSGAVSTDWVTYEDTTA
tara:strand:+ start:5562 stop:6494 length:933 start_codon:yes stop_codon:yes gene_type:complete